MASNSPDLENFLKYLRYEINRAPLTVQAYEFDLRQFSSFLASNNQEQVLIDYSLVTSGDVRKWLAELAFNGDTPRTLRRKTQSLRSFFKWMVKTGKIKVSPLDQISLPKIPKPLPDLIKSEEIETALSDITVDEAEIKPDDLMKALIVEMLYSLGLRRAELVAIDDRDISFDKAEIKITGKRNKQRIVPVPIPLLKKIEQWQKIRDEENPYLPEAKPLFITKGERIKVDRVYYIVNKSLQNSSARKKSPHALRHSFASSMLNGGADIDSVREFLGHASLSTTQIYTHISLGEIKKAYSSAHPRMNKKNDK